MSTEPAGPTPPSALAALVEAVGPRGVVIGADLAPYTRDWTGRWHGAAGAAVRPSTTDEVAVVVELCRRHGLALVPQGGNTGLVGGAIPEGGAIVLDTRRLDALGPVDPTAGAVVAGAGVSLGSVQAAAAAHGLVFGVDFAARDQATVGGAVATNAGGVHVLRWGAVRAQVLGIEAVLGTGRVVSHLTGLAKDNTGYDLAGLLCGSEGTLGVVTAATLRLRPVPRAVVVAMIGVRGTDALVELLVRWRGRLTGLQAMEFLVGPVASIVSDEFGIAPVFTSRWPVHVLVEVAGDDPLRAVTDVVGHDAEAAVSAVADDTVGRARLWSHRDRVPEALSRRGDVHKFDVSVPADALASFLADVEAVVGSVDGRLDTWLFGHLGDGNVHVNVTGPDGLLRGQAISERLDEAVLRCTVDHGGSISAEHGIGRAKRRWLHLMRSEAELDTFRRIKTALDPDGIMNPGVLLTPTDRDARAPHAVRPADPS